MVKKKITNQVPNCQISIHRLTPPDTPWPLNGNKRLKLLPILRAMRSRSKRGICIVGGGQSNMLAAAAALGRDSGFAVVVITRHASDTSFHDVLRGFGAEVRAVDEATFRTRDTPAFAETFQAAYPDLLFVAEGGANYPAFNDLRTEFAACVPDGFDVYTVSVGTGLTYAALLDAKSCSEPGSRIIGFSSFKNNAQQLKLIRRHTLQTPEILCPSTMGRFGVSTSAQQDIAEHLLTNRNQVFDPVYNLKSLQAIGLMVKAGKLDPSRVCHIDTGGRLHS